MPSAGVSTPPVSASDGRTRPNRIAIHRRRSSSSALVDRSARETTALAVMSMSSW
jgi:hypothetical protein